tara:strand:- start:1109 stop:1396 length:288 start_codon:yes stop_codon:yes gene_type:complete
MGLYINPPNMSKENWLTQHATPTSKSQWQDTTSYFDPVLLAHLNNGQFTALGIAYDASEQSRMTHPLDTRPVNYHFAPRTAVLAVAPELDSFQDG